MKANELNKAAEEYAQDETMSGLAERAFKAGAEWRENQMKMPDSSELIAAWYEAKSVLQEKDFRGDAWRLAYNAFMFGFAKGLNTKREK